ncbi:MAG: (S)-benzoin forming benzil reductase [Candidatus Marinimicrobia bacterium]|nr:(S)-benzoin forming benzil reductase [Candidatus Neomarinimicrobiota bacterium]
MRYVILTGASSGIGLAAAKNLLQQGFHVLAVSRHKNTDLIKYADKQSGKIDYIEFDLSKTAEIENFMEQVFGKIVLAEADGIHLINNAGVLEPVKMMEDVEPSEYEKSLSVNLVAPMALISQFLKQTGEQNIDKRIINISSGAGDHPYAGWAAYCTSKAGLDMVTRVVKAEQSNAKYPAQIVSFAPGVVATSMQKLIRSKSKSEFPHVDRFKAFHRNQQLLDPDIVGKKIAELLEQKIFPDGQKIDIRD